MPKITSAIVLAAGKGTRMQSDLPKVLHEANGRPMLQHVLDNLREAGIGQVFCVIGGEVEAFAPVVDANPQVVLIEQLERKGTADAVASLYVAAPELKKPTYANAKLSRGSASPVDDLLVCYGDVPGVRADTLREFMSATRERDAVLGVIGMDHPEPTGYGRMLVKGDSLERIIEHKDASDAQRKISVCNTGIMYGKADILFELLSSVGNENQSREYYLTDCIELARQASYEVYAHVSSKYKEFAGVNDKKQLAQVEAWMRGES